ncbi:dihydrolipoamide acetyltransferase family protein [Bradyrhizobium sp. AS23.2]|uniref:dihydrolipoamide acetyltransferase family protein n=1 Tax=Bradyrhizobium sp. AS23.2 TaxID=1680155 RepID=UPI00093B770E|nr:dihydrolipoamide acetyltransferase family protein [Bradyrhizobium sp. AS23.2]OKO69297.1 branched-chain alpha-keto acid dehydrogenase subunit E2 [Bradyrhizobium sp. AS23.2]
MVVHLVKLPDVGEGVAEAEVVEWHVAIGDEVAEDQILAAVMTDKATVEIPSPFRGRIREIGPGVGAMLAVGGKLAVIEGKGTVADDTIAVPLAPTTQLPAPAVLEPDPRQALLRADPQIPDVGASQEPRRRPPPARGESPVASPAVRARARTLGIDLRMVGGSGPGHRILHQDVDAFVGRDAVHASAPSAYARREGIEEVKVTGLRRKIAERMADATRRIAHFSYVEEIDLTTAEDLRAHLNARHGEARGRLTVLPFVLRALVLAVREFPQINAHYDDAREIVVRHRAVHAGIATQTDNGLMVPVVAHAETRDLWQSAAEIRRLAGAARGRSATREELSGSTISITSLGELGGIATTPVINSPEVAIIGINRLAVRPMWDGARFVPRNMMNLSSSFDHRVVDGNDAALFVRRIKELLEQPSTLFIEM